MKAGYEYSTEDWRRIFTIRLYKNLANELDSQYDEDEIACILKDEYETAYAQAGDRNPSQVAQDYAENLKNKI